MSRRDVIRLIETAPMIPPLDVRRVSDIKARPICWLWPGTIARGKVTMLAGPPGLGKSHIALMLAAIVTTGGRWPVSGAPIRMPT